MGMKLRAKPAPVPPPCNRERMEAMQTVAKTAEVNNELHLAHVFRCRGRLLATNGWVLLIAGDDGGQGHKDAPSMIAPSLSWPAHGPEHLVTAHVTQLRRWVFGLDTDPLWHAEDESGLTNAVPIALAPRRWVDARWFALAIAGMQERVTVTIAPCSPDCRISFADDAGNVSHLMPRRESASCTPLVEWLKENR